ncbi:MAG: hypothetical protein ACOY3S_00025 [Pseudomonadota bacterium]
MIALAAFAAVFFRFCGDARLRAGFALPRGGFGGGETGLSGHATVAITAPRGGGTIRPVGNAGGLPKAA